LGGRWSGAGQSISFLTQKAKKTKQKKTTTNNDSNKGKCDKKKVQRNKETNK